MFFISVSLISQTGIYRKVIVKEEKGCNLKSEENEARTVPKNVIDKTPIEIRYKQKSKLIQFIYLMVF